MKIEEHLDRIPACWRLKYSVHRSTVDILVQPCLIMHEANSPSVLGKAWWNQNTSGPGLGCMIVVPREFDRMWGEDESKC